MRSIIQLETRRVQERTRLTRFRRNTELSSSLRESQRGLALEAQLLGANQGFHSLQWVRRGEHMESLITPITKPWWAWCVRQLQKRKSSSKRLRAMVFHLKRHTKQALQVEMTWTSWNSFWLTNSKFREESTALQAAPTSLRLSLTSQLEDSQEALRRHPICQESKSWTPSLLHTLKLVDPLSSTLAAWAHTTIISKHIKVTNRAMEVTMTTAKAWLEEPVEELDRNKKYRCNMTN